MLPPLATISQAGLVSVIDVLPNVGVFVSINTPKDILVSINNQYKNIQSSIY